MFYYSILLALVVAWHQTLAGAALPPHSGKTEGYFRFLGSGGDPGDDSPWDETISLIPPFVHHFDTIGFPKISTDPYIEKDYSDKSFNILISSKDNCKKILLRNDQNDDEDATCLVLHDAKSGAQLWGTILPSSRVFSGCIPHFLGKSRVKLCFVQGSNSKLWNPEVQKASVAPFGTILCTFDPNGDALKFLQNDEECKTQGCVTIADFSAISPGKGAISYGKGFMIPESMSMYHVFHFHCHNLIFKGSPGKNPCSAVVQLSGFANEEIFCYDSLEDYGSCSRWNNVPREMLSRLEKVNENDLRFASQFFGTNTDKNEDTHAVIFGHVVETEVKTNEITGETFVWALLRISRDTEIDVVFRKSLLESQGSLMPKVGGVVYGHFWLSGVIMLDGADEYI